MGESTKIADQRFLLRLVYKLMELFDELPFVVTLEKAEYHRRIGFFQQTMDILQAKRSIMLRITLTQHVQIGSVDNKDAHEEVFIKEELAQCKEILGKAAK